MEESSADKSNWNILIKNIRRKFLDTVCENHENHSLHCPECVDLL